MYFNRKNAEQKNWRMIKKGKHFLFGCSLVFAVGASLATQTVHAETASESTVESGSKAKEAKPGYGGETGTYEAPAAVAETQPATVEKAVVAENTTAKTANKEALTQLVEEVKGLDKAGKTEESLLRLNTAFEQAQEVLANVEASQDQVDTALANLKEAVAQLATKEEKSTAVAAEEKPEVAEAKAEEVTEAATETATPAEPVRSRGKRDLSSRAAYRSVDGSLAEGEFSGAGVKQFQSVRYSVDGNKTTWTINVVPQHKRHQSAGLVVASDDTIESITVIDRGPNAGKLDEDYYVNKNFDKLPPMRNSKALASHHKLIGGGIPDSLTYRVVTNGTHHNLFARFATAPFKNTLENNGLDGTTVVKNRTSDFPTVGVNISSRLAPKPGVNNTYTQTNDTITVPTVASTDETLTGTGKPGATINIKVNGRTARQTQVAADGRWTFPLEIGLNSNVTGGAQLVPANKISVSQTVNGQESGDTDVNVSLGHSEIVPSDKSQQKNNLVQGEKNVTLKVPHDAGAAYFQFTDADGKAQEVGLKRDAVPGKWQVNSSNSALASVASSEDGKFYSTINLTLNKDMKAGTTAQVISNMQEGSYSSLQGWQSRNVEEAPKEETPAPVAPQPEPSKPSQPVVDGASETSGPEIVNDLAGKASTPADVTVKAPAGSTVKLYNKDGVVIGEAVANDQGVATVHPTNSLPEGEITATSTPAGGTESAKSAPITVTKTPTPIENKQVTTGPYKLQMMTNATKVTLYRGDKLHLTGDAAGTALRWFGITKATAFNVKGVSPTGGLATNGSSAIRNSHAETEGTVSWNQRLGDTTVTFRAEGSPNPTSNQRAAIERTITVTVLETTKKYDPVAGTKVDIANPNNVSDDEKNKIIDSVKTANPNLPAETQYSVDEKGNLTITYPDGSTDKVAAAYLVNPTTPARENVAPTVEIPYSNKATKEVYVYGGEANSFDIKFKDDSGKIASATVKQGGNKAFADVAGEANTINTQYGFKANVINAETPATADAPAVITYSGTPAATDGLSKERLDAATKGLNPEGLALGWRYATATDTDGAFIQNGATNASNATDPGAFRVMLKAQTQKYDIATPTEKVTVADPANVTEAELAKIKEKVQLEYSQNNDDANLADKKGTAVADKDAKIKSIEKDGNNLVVTYADGSQDKKPLSEFVNVAPTVELPYSNEAKKEIYVYTGENTDLTFKASDNTAVKDMYVRGPGGIGKDNTADYGFTTGKIENSAVTHGDGTVSGATATIKMTGVTTLKAPNHWTSFVVANDNDNAPSTTDFRALDQNPNATQTPGYVHFIVKSQTDKYDIATPAPADKVEVSDPTNVTDAELDKIKEKLQLEYNKKNDDANIAKDTPVDKDGKIKSVTKDADGNLVVTYTDGSTDKKPLSEFVTKKPTDADKNEPTPKAQTVDKGTEPKAEDSIGNLKDLPKGTTVAFKDPVDTTTPGEKPATAVVTYPDGSKEEVPVKVTVTDPSSKPTDADKNEPTPKAQTVDKGTEPKAEDSIGNLKDLPKGTTVAFKDPVDTTTPGEKPATAVVTYPDGSKEEVPVKVTVTDPSSKPTDADKNEPTPKAQTVDKGTEPKAEDSIGNLKDLPKGTTVAFKDPVDTTTPGEKPATAVVTYPDGSKEEVPVKVTVTDPSSKPTDADKNEPTPKAQTVDKGTEPKAEDSIGNLKDLPKGTTVAFKDPVDTTTPGEKPATAVVTYPDGSKEEVPVKVTVTDPSSKPTDADKNEPTPKAQTVDKGTEPKAEDSIGNLKDLPKGTTVAFKDPVDTTTPGEKPATAVVTYPDGSKEEVPVKVTVTDPSSKPTDADKNEPTPKAQTVDKGTEPKAEDSIGNLKDLPKGTTVAFKDPVDTTTPGEKPATAVVTYPDGSKEEVPVKVTVTDPSSKPTDADKNEPTPKAQTVDKGTEPKAEDSIGNLKDLPKGTTVAFKDPVDTTTPGEKPATAVVTYPDGSKEEVPVKVTVTDPSSKPTDADKNEPTPKAQTVDKGTEPKAEDSIGNLKDLPKGTTVAFKDPVDTTTPGEKPATAVVTYPDGSKEEVPVKVTVTDPSSKPTDADKNEPTPKAQTVDKGTEPKAEDSIGNLKDLPKGTTVAFKDPVDTTTPGEKPATAVVTYPDGSKEEVPVKVTVTDPSSKPTDADKNEPTPKAQTVDKGTEPKAEDSIGNLKDLPKGTTVAFKDPVDTTTPGEKPATAVVTYPDGSKEEVPVKVTVTDPSSKPTDADKNEPTPKAQTVDKGTEPKAEDSIGNLKDLPKGTTVAFKDPVDTTTPGEKPATAVVTYPDGSKEEVPVKVTVTDPSSKPTDADKNEPTPKAQTVDKGTEPKAEDSIGNLKDLPKGTTVAFKDPVDTTTPGEKPATAVVTYPDGSKEEVPVKVTVTDPSSKPTDADKNEPTPKAQTVDKGTEPKAEDSIGNLKDLPKGTTVAFKDPVDTTTPGEKPATAVVTYPDGSKEEVPVKVTVTDPSSKPTDADKNEPTPKAQTVDKGTEPKAEDSIGNLKDLPKGTTVAFKDPVDTTTPGEKPATAVVTYPDGSKEEVPVKVTVTDPSSKPTDADKNEPTPKAQTVDKGTEPKAEDSIGNLKDLPKGTTVAFKDPVDTTTPGEKPATAVVTYPDGSKEEVPVKVTVTDPSSKPTDADKNEPTPKAQTVDKGTEPKAEDSIGNLKDLPKGTTVAFKDPVDTTTPGEKPATAVVTYPDGSKEEVPVKVTVTDPSSKPTDADKNEPTPKAQTVDKGTEPKAEDSIGNLKDLPKGTTVAFKDPVDTTTPGEKPATAVVTYPDGSKEEVPVKVTVTDPSSKPTDADKNEPTPKAQTVDKGTEPKAEDSIGNLKDLPKGTTVAFKDPVDTTTPGEKPATAVVTYPDGSKEEVPVKVTVTDPSSKPTDADKNTPTAKEQTVKPGEKPKAEDSIDNLKDLPKGTTVEFKTPVDTTTPGDKTPTVVVTYPDGSKDEVPVKVTVKDPSAPATDADKNTPTAKEQTVKPGDKPSAKDSIGNVDDLPKGTTVEFKTPVDTTTPGDKTPTVVVTYPDGSKDEVPVKVTVKDPSAPATDADKNTPVAKDQTVKPGDKPSAKDSIGNVGDLPKGTTVEFKTPVDTTTPGDKGTTVVVTYPDGSKDEVPVKVTVKDPSAPATDADKNTPTAKDQTVKPGDKPSAKDSIGNVGDLPKGTTVEFKTPVDTTTPGDKGTTVVVTYPDGSKDEVPVKVTVKDPSAPATDADKNTPVAKDQTVKPGDKPSAKDSIGNVGDLPEGTTVEFKTPVDTTTPGDKGTTVVVTYPDGSKDEVPVKVTVKDPSAPATDADKNTPVAKDQTVKPGDKPSAKDSIGNVGDLPEGTTVEFKTPVDTTTPGDKGTTVVVTYPDGSKDEVPVKVTVKDPSAPATDADKNTPVAKDQTVKPGDKPSAKDSIGNVGDLPKGTTVEFKTPVDTTTPGDKGTTVVVTYPDGSKDEVPVKVTVKDPSAPATDADKNTPVAKDQTVKPGDKPSAKDSIGNVGDLPKGTTVEFKTPVDTTTPGDKGTTVVVTYPDGSKDEVPVKVTVKDPSAPATDADKNTPVAKDQTVKPGDKPSAKDSIGNVGDLPKGTTVEFKTPVDTTTPGDKGTTVVVTYPDGSKDEVPVKVTVKDPSAPATDADKNTPVAKDQTVKPGDKPSAKDSIGNVGDLPKGTTVEFKTPVDTTTPGDKGTTVVVTYPDGSKDEVPVKVTVKDPSAPATDADKNTPVAKDQTVKPGDKPSAKDSIGNVGDLPKGTTVEFKTPVDTTTPGDKGTTVVVTYPDGSKDEVPVKVTVKDPSAPATDADKNTPVAKDQTVKPGDKPSAKDSIGNVGDLPKGTTVEFKTPVDTTTPGDKGTTVVVTYPDGSKDEVPVKVTVKDPSAPATDADKNTPVAKDQTVKPGDKPSAKDSIGNVGDLPKGTTVEFKTPVDTTTPGDKGTTVVVTYPDGSKDEVPVKVTVKDPSAPATDADKNTPVAKDQTVKPGDKPSAKDSIGNVGDLPKGTTVEFKTPVDTTTPGDKGTTVVVTYPDGSKDEVPVKVTVKDPSAPATDADKNTPVAKDQTVKPGDKPSAKDSIGNVGDLPKGTTVEFKTPVDTTTPGDKGTTVVVTYPDGSKDEVPVKVTVKDPSAPATDADKNTPTAKDQTVKPGDKPSAKDSIGNVGDLPKGTTVEFKTPVDTTTPGDKGTTVVVTYPDGSKDEVPVKVTVKDPSAPATDADKNTPVAKDQTVKPGDKPSAKDSIGNVGDLPKGTTVEFKTPVDTTTPGDKGTTVVVTYPDGSKDEVPVKVTVKDPSAPATDADKNTPVAKDQTVKPGDKPSAKDSIGNVGDLPKGTTVEFKTPVDTTTPGDKGTTVVVTYPDGSKDEVPVKVTVKDPSAPATDADKNTPVAKDQTVKPGDKPSAKDSIGNVGDLPKGTTVEFKTPVDTTTPGDKGTTVVVTYPDGSKDEVPVKVTVKDPSAPATDADKNTPTAKDQTVKPGDKPSAKDSIGNVGDLPKGTTVEFKTPVDTTTPGDKGTTVVVTYPDGSKDEVPVKVTVKDPSAPATDADKNTPVAKDQTVKPGDKPSAKDSIGNVGDLPKGTTVEFKTPVDTTTPGDKGTTVVVTYPDGSKDEVPVKVTVKDPSAPATDADKNKVTDPSVTPVTDPSNLTDAEKAKDAEGKDADGVKDSPAQAPAKKAGAKELPNTGTEQSSASLALALLAAATGGLLFAKKREEEE